MVLCGRRLMFVSLACLAAVGRGRSVGVAVAGAAVSSAVFDVFWLAVLMGLRRGLLKVVWT